MAAKRVAVRRLKREAIQLQKNPPEFVMARPDDGNILDFHYVVTGPPDTPYAGGKYWGVLRFPPDYPMKPPAILMYTPSGRFQVNTKLCLSISSYHPESWCPHWSVDKVLVGLLSFMSSDEPTLGSMRSSESKRRELARSSMEWNVRQPGFRRIFPDLVEQASGSSDGASSAAAPVAVSGGVAGASSTSSAPGRAREEEDGAAAPMGREEEAVEEGHRQPHNNDQNDANQQQNGTKLCSNEKVWIAAIVIALAVISIIWNHADPGDPSPAPN